MRTILFAETIPGREWVLINVFRKPDGFVLK